MNQINLHETLFLKRCDEVSIEILEEEITKIAKDLNIKPWKYTFHRYNTTSFIDPENKIIRFKFNTDYDFDRMVITLAHELRHQYQLEIIKSDKHHPKKEEWKKEYNKIVSKQDDTNKLFNTLEIDATAYAINYVKTYHNSKIVLSNKELNNKINEYTKENF